MPYAIKFSLVKRTIFGYVSIGTTVISIQLMPVSVAVSLMMLLGLTTSLLAYFLMDEVLSIPELCAILGGFFGCLLITNSDMFITNNDSERLELLIRESEDDINYPFYGWGVFFAMLFCVCAALNCLAMRELGNMVHSSVKTFYFGALSSILTIIFFIFYNPAYLLLWTSTDNDDYTVKGDELLSGVIIGFFAWAAQESMSLALSTVKAGTLTAFFSLGLICSWLVDFIYLERQAFWTDYVGSFLILVCIFLQAWMSSIQHDESNKDEFKLIK